LENNPEILEKYQKRANHLLVDEYQDINAAQFKLIELLSRKNRNGLFVVGDDAQSIYAFRGANPKFILNFPKDFPGAKSFPLPFSRRCHEKIMKDATKVLKKYYREWTGEQTLEFKTDIGKEPFLWQLPSEKAEAELIAILSKKFINGKKTVLILVPKRNFFSLILKRLFSYGIISDCSINFIPERIKTAQLFIEWVKMPNDNFKTRLAVEELINRGVAKVKGARKKKNLKPETIRERTAAETEIAKFWESVDKKNSFFESIKNAKVPSETIVKIKDGLCSLTRTYNNSPSEDPGGFAKQLSVVSGIWQDPSKLGDDIISVTDLLKNSNSARCGLVQLKTMRKAKGLEADVVIIAGLENDIAPNPNNDIDEESRLFYVSMTRAKQELFLFHCYKRPRNISFGEDILDKPRSQFLDTIGRSSEWKEI
jgi:DNA helicase-2/ATP-dependent DNA helicase PcrA